MQSTEMGEIAADARSATARAHDFWPRICPSDNSKLGSTLFTFSFGGGIERSDPETGLFSVPLECVDAAGGPEAWDTVGTVTGGISGDLIWRRSDGAMAVHLQRGLGPDPAETSRAAYEDILALFAREGYSHLVRVWNVLPDINAGSGDEERYRQFCLGRAMALDKAVLAAGDLPAATAVGGAPDVPLTITAVASPTRPEHRENPRQTSAYRYPRQYGPRSPSFARATAVTTPYGEQLLISGTASIVGHETLHRTCLDNQLVETLRNISTLASRETDRSDGPVLNGYGRVYLRRADDWGRVRDQLTNFCSGPLTVLRGDICRSELLLEIEASHHL